MSLSRCKRDVLCFAGSIPATSTGKNRLSRLSVGGRSSLLVRDGGEVGANHQFIAV